MARKNNFYLNSEGGQPDIEMPPLKEEVAQPTPQSIEEEIPEVPAESEVVTPVTPEAPVPVEEHEEEIEEAYAAPKSAAANMRALREAKEKAEQERNELMRMVMMQQQQQMQQNQPKQQAEPEEIDDFDLEDDALVEGKSMRKMHNEIKSLKKQLNQTHRQSIEEQKRIAQSVLETNVKATMPDFDSVCSQDNIETFKTLYPDMASSIAANPDPYSQARAAYSLFKQLGVYKTPELENDRLRAIKNSNKPRPLASVNPQQGDSPLSKANAFANAPLTEDLKKNYYREMQEAIKNG